jgi:hypothetical protein
MGCFSFKCKESGKPAWSSSFDGDAVRMFLLKNGKVIEEMRGHYDSYGRVFDSTGESFEWKTPWSSVCELMFDPDKSNGIAVILENKWKGKIPTTRSEDDPDQGWGRKNGGKAKIDNPYHKVYNDAGEEIEYHEVSAYKDNWD